MQIIQRKIHCHYSYRFRGSNGTPLEPKGGFSPLLKTPKKLFFRHVLLLLTLGLIAQPAWASLLVYEGFSYGGTNGAMNGRTATGTGLSGNYAVDAGTGSANYSATGNLSFGSNFLSSSGGALSLSAAAGPQNKVLGVALDSSAALASGTLWGSYLVNFSLLSSSGGGLLSLRVADDITAGTNIHYRADAESSSVRRPGVGYDGTTTNTATGTIATGTTYLVLSKYTNVGTTAGTANLWMMTQTQYDTWVTAGFALEANLTANSTWAVTDTVSSGSIAYNFGLGQYLNFAVTGSGSVQTAIVDELRYGTDLADFVAVPEPSSYALLAAGIGALFLLRRQNKFGFISTK